MRRQHVGELQRGLATERHNNADGVFGLDDVHHVFVGERFEIEPVAGVVVGRDRLGVAVDHDGLIPGLGQREAGVNTAIVELDALTNPVRARPQDDDAGLGTGTDLVFVLIGRVVVWRRGFELGGTRVDGLEGRRHTRRGAGATDVSFGTTKQVTQLHIGKPEPLGPTPRPTIHGLKAGLFD